MIFLFPENNYSNLDAGLKQALAYTALSYQASWLAIIVVGALVFSLPWKGSQGKY